MRRPDERFMTPPTLARSHQTWGRGGRSHSCVVIVDCSAFIFLVDFAMSIIGNAVATSWAFFKCPSAA